MVAFFLKRGSDDQRLLADRMRVLWRLLLVCGGVIFQRGPYQNVIPGDLETIEQHLQRSTGALFELETG